MTSPSPSARDLHTLLHKLLYGDLSPAEFATLEARLLADPQARQLYREILLLHVGLYSRYAVVPLGRAAATVPSSPVPASPPRGPIAEADRVQDIQARAERRLQAFLAEQARQRQEQERRARRRPLLDWRQAIQRLGRGLDRLLGATARLTVGVAVAASLVLALLAGLHALRGRPILAQVESAVQARWSQVPPDEGLRAGAYALECGYARLRFTNGVQTLLQAPCRFRLHTVAGLSLEAGTLTATVPPAAVGFTIDTPCSRVVDYGTEFGVLVDSEATAEIHVFQGAVGVRAAAAGGQDLAPQRLGRGQNALASLREGVQVGRSRFGGRHFTRRLPVGSPAGVPGATLDLADVVGGGNGLGTGVSFDGQARGAIHPLTGRVDQPVPLSSETSPGITGGYCPVAALPLVDGVFVPDRTAGGCRVSSTGPIWADCPDTDGTTLWGVTNGWYHRNRDPSGTRTNTPALSRARGITLHANAGVTFDLAALRRAHSGVPIVRFTARAGIPVSPREDVSEADFWVLVDGRVRFVARRVTAPRMVSLAVEIHDTDRFLSLVATDGQRARGGFTYAKSHDWGFFADPTLHLASGGSSQ